MNDYLLNHVKDVCHKNNVVLHFYDMPIEQSEYSAVLKTLMIGTKPAAEHLEAAVVLHELAHIEQEKEKYWAMYLCHHGVFPGIFQLFVEADATKRAIKKLWPRLPMKDYESAKKYLNENYLTYRKKNLGF